LRIRVQEVGDVVAVGVVVRKGGVHHPPDVGESHCRRCGADRDLEEQLTGQTVALELTEIDRVGIGA